MAKLDELDMKILSSLYSDASVSVPKLSSQMGVNLSVMYSRIKRLQRKGIIEKFTIEVNEANLGMRASALAGLNIDPKLREAILKDVERIEGVRVIREVTGRFDIILNMKGQSLDELHKAVYDVIGRIPGVMHAEIFMEVSRKAPAITFKIRD